MIVREVMKTDVATCMPQSDLGSAIKTMQSRDCGFLPVLDANRNVVGVVTDRDVCLAAGARHRPLDRIAVEQVMSHPVFSCLSDDNLRTVLVTMARRRIRRLPVIDKSGHLEGVLSIDDVAQAPHRRGAPTAEDVVDALKAICTHAPIEGATA